MLFKRTRIPYNGRDKYYNANGKKVNRKSLQYGFSGSGSGSGGLAPLQVDNQTISNIAVDVETSVINIPIEDISSDGYTVVVPINGFADNDSTEVWVGDVTNSAETNYSISGICSGMSVNVTDNGTTEPKLHVTFRNTMTEMSGELLIPVTVNNRKYMEVWSATTASWAEMTEKKSLPQRILSYSWNIKTSGGGSGYQLILTNETAILACNSNGTPYQASIANLSCTATLYYGAQTASGVTYSIMTDAGTQGVTINPSTGELSFSSNFDFLDITTKINIQATVDSSVVATKEMKITKVKDGSDGSGGTISTLIRWIVPSVYSIVKDNEDNVNPTAITATVMMQSGNTAAVVDTGTTIFYGYAPDHINPNITMPNTGITVSNTIDYLILALRNSNQSSGEIYESQTIPIISDGANGPAIRGPISWRSSLARRFSNGSGPQVIDKEFIDIVRYQAHTYKCVVSYTQTSGSTWAQVSSAWTLDDSYNFVASEVDLARDEAITLHPSNAIVMNDNNNNTVGYISDNGVFLGSSSFTNSTAAMTRNGAVKGSDGYFLNNVTADQYRRETDFKTIQYANLFNCFNFDTVISDDGWEGNFSQVEETGTWQYNGIDSQILYEEYPYIFEASSDNRVFDGKDGWIFYSMVETVGDVSDFSEVAFAGVVTSQATRNKSTIYITI